MEWWKQHGETFPLLAQMARDLYCVPASSSSSERAFSESGLVINDRRTRLDTGNAEKLIFCQQNYEQLAPKISRWSVCSEEEKKAHDLALEVSSDPDDDGPSQLPDTEDAYTTPKPKRFKGKGPPGSGKRSSK